MSELEDSGADPGRQRLRDGASVPGGRRTVRTRIRIADEDEFGRIAALLRELPEVHAVHRTRER